jgi:hypothetical protein
MDKFTLTKTIEARKLNKRTLVPIDEPAVTIPFGAIIEDPVQDRDVVRFTYLGEPYRCLEEVFRVASAPIQTMGEAPPVAAIPPEKPGIEARLQWEQVESSQRYVLRAKVPGGWLVLLSGGGDALAFYPDPEHRWDGALLP